MILLMYKIIIIMHVHFGNYSGYRCDCKLVTRLFNNIPSNTMGAGAVKKTMTFIINVNVDYTKCSYISHIQLYQV